MAATKIKRIDPAKLSRARMQKGWSQERLASELQRAGVDSRTSVRTLQTYESTGRVPDPMVTILANVLDVPEQELLPDAKAPWRIPLMTYDRSWMPPAALLRADVGAVEFHFREKEISSLRQWCSTPQRTMAMLCVGPGGIGKTRLATEICRVMSQEESWRAGFLDYKACVLDLELWKDIFNDPSPLLLVMDYADHRSSIVLWLLQEAIKRNGRNNIRFLFLARKAGEWWERLKNSDLAREFLRGPALSRLNLPPIALSKEKREESHAIAAKAFGLALSRPLSCGPPENLEDECFGRALLIHMHALASVEGVSLKGEDGLLDYVLGRERSYWEGRLTEASLPVSLLPALGQMMVIATLAGGIQDEEDGLNILSKLPFLKDRPHDVIHALNQILSDCYPCENWIGPILPDLLGERLIETHASDGAFTKAAFQLVRLLK